MASRRDAESLTGDWSPEEGGEADRAATGTALPTVPGFHILRVLGEGSFGTVYEARQLDLKRTVALKVMRPEHYSKRNLRQFDSEMQTLATLQHPNVARIYEASTVPFACLNSPVKGVEADALVPYYTMEQVRKALPLDVYVQRNQLSVRRRVEVFLKVCDAVYAGNRQGVVHRDLKPSNILVDESGEPKVIDFGLVRVLGASLLDPAAGYVCDIAGTLAYMSPEQMKGDEVDERSDVFALGVVLYQLVTDRLPFERRRVKGPDGRSLIETRRTRASGKPIHPDLESIVSKAMAKKPKDRYQTADALRVQLQRCLDGELPTDPPPTFAQVVGRRVRQTIQRAPNAAMVSAASIIGLLLVFVGIQAVYAWTPANRMYRSAMAAFVPSLSPTSPDLEHVRVILIDQDSHAAFEDLAAEYGVEGVANHALGTVRPLSGHLMKRLVVADPAVVSWDLAFRRPSDGDAMFVEGVKALRERGIPVLVVFPQWGIPAGGTEGLISSVIAPHVESAIATIVNPNDFAGQQMLPEYLRGREGWAHVVLAIDRGRLWAIHGYAIRTVAAYRQPRLHMAAGLDQGRSRAEIHYYRSGAEDASRVNWVGHHEYVRVSGFDQVAPQAEYNLLEGDVRAVYSVQMPSHEALDRATYSYKWALRATDGELRSAFAGKIVVIGESVRDVHDLGLGKTYCGPHIQARAIDAILRSDLVRLEGDGFKYSMIAVGCLLGLMSGAWVSARRRRAIIVFLVSAAALFLLSVAMYSLYRFMFNPILPATALLLTGIAAHLVQRTRQTHLV